ncbi:hypothetical protein V6259_18620 [Marinomonas sp. TI.3.20]|uniref:hypothetical protein n=1 Tax=Marinomonas sp. TI.3.20 TaxID=3121296 RepID=UPI00311F758E
MKEKYLQYEIAELAGFYGVYFGARFLVAVDSFEVAKAFVDRRVSERLTLLLSAEFGVMADRALTSIDGRLSYEKSDANLGWKFYEISQEACTHLEIEIVESVSKNIPDTMAFEIGYSEAKEALSSYSEDKEALSSYSEDKERQAYSDNKERHHEQLVTELELKRNYFADDALKLMPPNVNPASYDELSRLPVEALRSLAKMEEFNVNLADDDESIDGRTSGHHREIRDILMCAANGKSMDECCADIYMDNEGVFNFNLIEHVMASKQSSTVSTEPIQ